MSFALTIGSYVTPLIIGASPVPCPEGQTQVPVALVDGTVVNECREAAESTKASTEDAARYAELEAKTPAKVSEFRGGSSGIYISVGAAILILAIVLLVIFL